MALIICKECGGKMSDRATECPHCGCPIEYQKDSHSKIEHTPSNHSNIIEGNKSLSNKIVKIAAISMSTVIGVILFGLCANYVLFNCFGIGSPTLSGLQSNAEEAVAVAEEEVIEAPIDVQIQNAKTPEEVRTLLNGTTWHYAENLSKSEIEGWFKVRFEGDNYIAYTALPSDGVWTETERGKYKISEGRFSNTGEKYICVEWKSKLKVDYLDIPCEFALATNNFQVRVTSSFLDGMSRINNIYSTKHYAKYGVMGFGDYVWD